MSFQSEVVGIGAYVCAHWAWLLTQTHFLCHFIFCTIYHYIYIPLTFIHVLTEVFWQLGGVYPLSKCFWGRIYAVKNAHSQRKPRHDWDLNECLCEYLIWQLPHNSDNIIQDKKPHEKTYKLLAAEWEYRVNYNMEAGLSWGRKSHSVCVISIRYLPDMGEPLFSQHQNQWIDCDNFAFN